MGILDRLNSLADKMHIGSDQNATRDTRRTRPAYEYEYPPPYDAHQQQYQDYQQGGYQQDYPYEREEAPGYGEQGYEDYGYDGYQDGGYEQQQYQEPAYDYESAYGSGDGYARAGARVVQQSSRRAAQQQSGGGFFDNLLDRFRRNPPEPEPEMRRPSNVVPMQRREPTQYVRGDQYDRRPVYGEPEPEIEPEPIYEEPAPPPPPANHKTLIHLVRRLDDAEQIIDHMLGGGNVIVNMEEIDDALKRRVLDVVSGAAYALEATIKRISYATYYVAPSGQEVLTNVNVRERERDALEEGMYRSSRRY